MHPIVSRDMLDDEYMPPCVDEKEFMVAGKPRRDVTETACKDCFFQLGFPHDAKKIWKAIWSMGLVFREETKCVDRIHDRTSTTKEERW